MYGWKTSNVMTFFTHSSHMSHDIKCTMQSGGSKNIDLLTDSPEPLAAAGSAWQTSLRSPQHGTGACMCVSVRVYVDVCMHACVSSGIGAPMFRYMYGTGHRAIPTTFSIVSIALAWPHAQPPHASFKRRDFTSRQWCWPGCSGCPGIPRRRACSSDDQQPAAFKPEFRQQPGDDRVGAGWMAGVGCWREVFGNVALGCTCMHAYIHACMQTHIHICMHPHTHAYSYTCPMQRTSDAEWCDGAPVTS